MDIGIYTTKEKWKHKKNNKENDGQLSHSVFWTLKNPPSETVIYHINKVYFAFDGYWQGYFLFDYGLTTLYGDIHFYSATTWKWLKNKIPRKQFQGFTYKVPNQR